MKKVKQNVSVVLAIAVTATSLVACNTDTPKATTGTSTTPKEPPMVITWTGRNPPSSDDNAAQKYLEQKFNVKLKNINLDPTTWRDQLNVKIAAGEIPDVITQDAGLDLMQQWADQGVIASISVEEIKKYMPKYSADMEKIDPNIFSFGSYKGKNWGLPKVYLEGKSPFLPAFNADWMKAVGVTKVPETLQEVEDLLTKFRNNDPDGNGKKDTYGLSASSKDAPVQMFSSIFAAFGIKRRGWNLGADGKVVYGMITEESRQAFKLLSKWYKDGLIDPEFATDDWIRNRANFLGGRIGMVDSGMWYHLYESGAVGAEWKAKGQTLAIGKGFKGPSGKAMLMSSSTIPQAPQMFSAALMKDEKKRIKILQMMEDIATNEETYLITGAGRKGIEYDLVDGSIVAKGDGTDPVKLAAAAGAGIWFNHVKGAVPSMSKFDNPQAMLDYKEKLNSGIEVTKDPVNPALLPSTATVSATLNKLVDEYMIKLITGEVDTDKGFDAFVAQWKKAGGDQQTLEVNQIYEERKKK
ncbi:extracellular solute-binding protein [Paenibacillus hodogayensis]|uniref:Extracellular solute-binding protein n=1 Tax=Paenibacillus hodogayensis TaxID=279208 RepID=A0ABV5W8K3_9BACL